jgi:hypothetical protein
MLWQSSKTILHDQNEEFLHLQVLKIVQPFVQSEESIFRDDWQGLTASCLEELLVRLRRVFFNYSFLLSLAMSASLSI